MRNDYDPNDPRRKLHKRNDYLTECPSEELLRKWTVGDLAYAIDEDINQHYDTCPSCQDRMILIWNDLERNDASDLSVQVPICIIKALQGTKTN